MSPSSPAERSAAAEVIALDTPNLGDRSYVVGVDGLAVVVDPQRDSTGCSTWWPTAGGGSPTSSRPMCTTTT